MIKKNIHQLDWSWIQACENEAAGNLEQAAYEYKLLLNEHFKNAIRAMSCFENRDFEGLKVSMRKMTNSQVTGEELGRSISCSWDMEAFDMLATVETLKRASKRRSSLWSLNAVLQLTQDLTRIHNVDEHASWSEELAAISQVTALYQSENREVPLLPGQKFAPAQHSVRSLNSI
ncbi:unnamed protein product, partial [Rotaria magnacalcarata]